MTDTTTSAAQAAPKKQAVALRDWIDISGKPVASGEEHTATGLRYTHLPTAKRLDPKFDPESIAPHVDATFECQFATPAGSVETMLSIFGGMTLAGNVVNTAVNGPKGDPNINPIPLIRERFAELEKGIWADKTGGGSGVRYDSEKLAQAIANAKGETDPTPYAAKMANKVDKLTGQVVPPDTKSAISYGAYALRNAKVKAAYDALAGTGSSIDAL